MRKIAFLASVIGACSLVVGAGVAQARGRGVANVVFVQTNALTGNQVVVYDRARDGTLAEAGTYATGGDGGAAQGAAADLLASQGSLTYDAADSLLFAVNAGSDTVSVFDVSGDRLRLQSVLPSGGEFPASVAVSGRLAYVLDAGGAGSLQGFRIDGHDVYPIHGSNRSLGLANANPPNFLSSPGQVGFTPDGNQLIVTTKASGSDIDLFRVRPNGRLNAPVVNAAATGVPFSFTFDPAGRLVSGEAASSTLTTYALGADGTLSDPQSLADGQAALCWIASVRGYYYVANAGSANISGYSIDADGTPSFIVPGGVVGSTEAGAIDLAGSSDGRFLYAESGGAGTVDEFAVNGDGTLTKLGDVTLSPGLEGIATS